MHLRHRKDSNHNEIVQAFERLGCTVADLSQVGAGVPDILVGCQGRNLLVEIKDGKKSPSKRRLNQEQVEWHRKWRGSPVAVVENGKDVLCLVKGVNGA